MRRLLISALLLCSAPVSAQHLAPEDYIFPLRDVAGLYSANFGEMRPNHFHSGIDIKTDGVTGKPVLATADGYISRIAVTPGGYGRAIYITHPNGTTSVYGHLSKFRDDIEKYVHEERYRTRRNSINLYPPADRFPLCLSRIAGSYRSALPCLRKSGSQQLVCHLFLRFLPKLGKTHFPLKIRIPSFFQTML